MKVRNFRVLWMFCAIVVFITLFISLPRPFPTFMDRGDYFSSGPDKIDINSAPIAEITCLPGIGEKKAERIIAYRTENDGFTMIEELLDVQGISAQTLETIRPFIFIKGET